jgi:hypothetical protein
MLQSRAVVLGLAVASACSFPSSGAVSRSAPRAPVLDDRSGGARTCAIPPPKEAGSYVLRFDQLGYLPGARKWAVVLGSDGPAPRYDVVDASSGCALGGGVAGPRVLDTTSRAGSPLTSDFVDLSAMEAPGSYFVVLEDG